MAPLPSHFRPSHALDYRYAPAASGASTAAPPVTPTTSGVLDTAPGPFSTGLPSPPQQVVAQFASDISDHTRGLHVLNTSSLQRPHASPSVAQYPSSMDPSEPSPGQPSLLFGYEIQSAPDQEDATPPEPPAETDSLLSPDDGSALEGFFSCLQGVNMSDFGEGLANSYTFNFPNTIPPSLMSTPTSIYHLPQMSHMSHMSQLSQLPQSLSGPPSRHILANNDHYTFSRAGSTQQVEQQQHQPQPNQRLPQNGRQHSLGYGLHTAPDSSFRNSSFPAATSDVLDAASALTGGALLSAHQNNIHGNGNDLHQVRYTASQRQFGTPMGQPRHQGLEEFHEGNRRIMATTSRTDPVLVPLPWPQRHMPTERQLPEVAYQYGSDSNFDLAQGYNSGASRETLDVIERERLKLLECLNPPGSTPATQHDSPSSQQAPSPEYVETNGPAEEEYAHPPRKRRRSGNVNDRSTCKVKQEAGAEEEEEEEEVSRKAVRRGKSKQEQNSTSFRSPAAGNSRSLKPKQLSNNYTTAKPTKSKPGASKPTTMKSQRETLTEDQRRTNHINSEKKRRGTIQGGYAALEEHVPGLDNPAFSKAGKLCHAADWLYSMFDANELLEAQLRAMEQRRR
ncbi:hypothetical protein S40293_03364 [Stachybotrys chartarum IBT 40293]|nr:hypothetical protein S40293_03364 [Stachybotrys chartarum IBT 40293]